MMAVSTLEKSKALVSRLTIAACAVWSLILLASYWWTQHVAGHQSEKIVLNVAQAYFDKDLAFRLWGTSHGGVYVPISEHTEPNPYLKHVPERDIVTPSGRRLTLMNPAYMIRQMMETFSELTGVTGHLTSLHLLNPINAPDEWEKEALLSFEQGNGEKVAFVEQAGEQVLRLSRPFITKEGCLKCHASQGYKVGDVRGATSITIPMRPYLQFLEESKNVLVATHLAIWALGLLGILFSSSRLRKNLGTTFAMQEHLAEQHEFVTTVLESLTHPFYVIDADTYQVVMANSAALKGRENKGLSCYSLGHGLNQPCSGADHQCPLKKVVDERESTVVEHVHLTEDGRKRYFEIQCFPVCDKDGHVKQVIEYAIDVTDKKKSEQERLQLSERLQQAQKMEAIGTLAGGIAHDFNNILSGIYGYAQLVQIDADDTEMVREHCRQILNGSERAKGLVKQILTFSRKTNQEKQPLQIAVIVKEALKLLCSTLPKTIEIKKNIASDSVVLADPSQVHQIIMNLCTNAYHAMRESGGILGVELTEVELNEFDRLPGLENDVHPGTYVRLVVSDTGCGIEPAVRQKIFEPYFTTKQQGEGTGLGLAVAHGIVQEHQGFIHVYSEPGCGTSFHVYLPVLAEESAGYTPIPADQQGQVRGGDEKIILVDDEKDICEACAQYLRQLGYEVTIFTDPRLAAENLEREPGAYDLLITDMTMPGLTGMELAKVALAAHPNLPVVLCTGHSDLINRQKALEAGVRDYFEKPVVFSRLASSIRQIFDDSTRV